MTGRQYLIHREKQQLDRLAEEMKWLIARFHSMWPRNGLHGWHREQVDDRWELIEGSGPDLVQYVLHLTAKESEYHWGTPC